MPVLTDEDVGLAPAKTLSDADVGIALSDEDVGITTATAPKDTLQFRDDLKLPPARSSEELAARNFYEQWRTTGKIPSVQSENLWKNITDPLIRFAPKTTAPETQAAIDVLAHGEEGMADPMKQPGTAAKAITGVQNAVADTIDAFTSPLGIATLGIGALPKGVQSLLSAGFATHMATTLPEQASGAVEAIKAGDTEAAAKHIAGTALTSAFVGLAGKHAVTSGKAAIGEIKAEAAKAVGPATAAAVGVETAPATVSAPVERVTTLEAPKSELEAPKAITVQSDALTDKPPELMTPKEWVASGRKKGTQYPVIDDRPLDLTLPPEMELKEIVEAVSEKDLSPELSSRIRSHVGNFFDPAGAALQELFRNPELRRKLRTETEFMREMLRRKYGDTVTVYRAADPFPRRSAARTVFSWTLDPEIAAKHKRGVGQREIVSRKVPVDVVEWLGNPVESEVLINILKLRQLDGLPVPKNLIEKYGLNEPITKPTGLGAATPAEFELKPRNETSIKNATVDQERASRGLPPAMEPARRSFGAVWDQAMTKMDADYQYPDRLVAELREKPRAITDVEDATLLHRQVELQNEYTKAARDLAQAFDDGRLEDVELQKVRVAGLSDQLLDLYNINKAAGTETARGLNARKMLAYEDFSLAKMELEKRAAKGGEQLTDTERSEVVRVNKRVDETQKAYDEYVERTEERARGEAADRALKEVEALEPPKEPLEKITEGLQEKFMAGQADAITSLIQKLARYFVAQGIKERDPLLAAVHDVVKTIDPTLTPRDTMDAISGYGKYRRLSKDEISKELRDLKGQMQQVAKLEDMEAKRPPLKTGSERRVPSVEERRLIRLVNEAKNKFQVPITDEATQLKSSLDMLKTRLRNRMGELEDKLARKDFTKAPRRVIQLDAEAQRLHFEAAKVKARWHEALMKDRLARRSVPAKIIGGVGETVNTIRAIMTSGEFSAVFKQGGFTGFGNPARMAKAFPAMMRALRSEAQQHAVNMEIMARPNYPMYVRSKLYLAEHGQKLSQMEEAYMSRWAGKIPVVAGTQRAYSTFLNKLRADSFDALSKTLVRWTGELTPERAADISNFINVSTGRGSFGVNGDAALVVMNTAFFAPRWVASRFQLLLGQPFWKPLARKDWPMVGLLAVEYGKFLTAMGVIYGLWGMAGGEVETDSRSSDFGKLRTGNTRVDLMAGLQQQTVLLSRVGSGETKKLSGQVVPIRGEDIPFGRGDTAAVIGKFLRGKLAPVPASGLDLLSGKDVVDRPVTLESELTELSTPLTYRDIYKAMIEQGVPEGTALALLAIFGAGVQTYDR